MYWEGEGGGEDKIYEIHENKLAESVCNIQI